MRYLKGRWSASMVNGDGEGVGSCRKEGGCLWDCSTIMNANGTFVGVLIDNKGIVMLC